MEVLKIDNTEAKVKGKMVPIWKKYMLTVDEAVQYFGIGEKKIRMLISENTDTDYIKIVPVETVRNPVDGVEDHGGETYYEMDSLVINLK